MAKRAAETFITAANTVDGRRRVFRMDEVVPDDVAKVVGTLVYDDGAPTVATADGTPEHACPDCDFVAKSAAGLGAHGRTHDDG